MSQRGNVSFGNSGVVVLDVRRGVGRGHGEEKTHGFDEEILLSGLPADTSNAGSRLSALRSCIGRKCSHFTVGIVCYIVQRTEGGLVTFIGKLYVGSGG